MNPFVVSNLESFYRGKKVLLGISGSIAAFKAHDLIRFLKEMGADVKVVLSPSAEKFVSALTLETLSGNSVLTDLWESKGQGTHHIDTARWADLVMLAPASANLISRLANGMADDLLTTEVLAFDGPVLVAPAMNPRMYAHPATQANLKKLESFGYFLIGPVSGETSCGEVGLGRMMEPETILETAVSELAKCWAFTRKKILITVGPTRSALDPVRYFSNRSSGRMGAAISWAATCLGYDVTVVSGPISVPLPQTATVFQVETSFQMAEKTLQLWQDHDIFVSAAAVLDWQVENSRDQKLKKENGAPEVKWSQTIDILKKATELAREDQKVLGFAAETQKIVKYAQQKLKDKGCDAIFANDLSQALGTETNSGWWIAKGGTPQEIPLMSKPKLAMQLLKRLEKTEASSYAPGLKVQVSKEAVKQNVSQNS